MLQVVWVGVIWPELQTSWWKQPVRGLQVSTVQSSLSAQLIGAPPTHEPALQTSPLVQTLPSLQVVPSGLTGLEQAPVETLQVPAVWH